MTDPKRWEVDTFEPLKWRDSDGVARCDFCGCELETDEDGWYVDEVAEVYKQSWPADVPSVLIHYTCSPNTFDDPANAGPDDYLMA